MIPKREGILLFYQFPFLKGTEIDRKIKVWLGVPIAVLIAACNRHKIINLVRVITAQRSN